VNIEVDVGKRLGGFDLQARFTGHDGITALFGPSGSGKTSIINMIAGLLRPDSGRIVVGERVLFDAAGGIDVPARGRRVGYVFQDARLFPHLSVHQNLAYGWRRTPETERFIGFDLVVDLLALAPLLERRPGKLSGGEKQRVALGRALLASPRVLLMDEPLASLDLERKVEILPYIERLRDQFRLPIIYVSHAIEEVVRLAGTLVLLSKGRVAATGSVEELMGRLDLSPIAGRHETGAVVAARVGRQLEDHALTELEFDGGTLLVPRVDLPAGHSLRVQIRARDVAVATRRPEAISMRNILAGRIEAINLRGPDAVGTGAHAELRIMIGRTALIARITRQTIDELSLSPGMEVYALIKSIAMDRQSLGLPAGPHEFAE